MVRAIFQRRHGYSQSCQQLREQSCSRYPASRLQPLIKLNIDVWRQTFLGCERLGPLQHRTQRASCKSLAAAFLVVTRSPGRRASDSPTRPLVRVLGPTRVYQRGTSVVGATRTLASAFFLAFSSPAVAGPLFGRSVQLWGARTGGLKSKLQRQKETYV